MSRQRNIPTRKLGVNGPTPVNATFLSSKRAKRIMAVVAGGPGIFCLLTDLIAGGHQ